MKNARFWVLVNSGFVKLTLRPGDQLQHNASGYHDEGWWSVSDLWDYNGQDVAWCRSTDGTDCDGRLSTYAEKFASIDNLRDHPSWRDRSTLMPKWEDGESHQRDYAAEAMGY